MMFAVTAHVVHARALRFLLCTASLFVAFASPAAACKYQNINNAPCPADCKEDGGEVECVAPVFKAKVTDLQSYTNCRANLSASSSARVRANGGRLRQMCLP
jgi:hypothetical protein